MTPKISTLDLLQHVEKPSRYCGGEWNEIRKQPDTVRVHFALAYPDSYEVGMSHLGLRILYHLLNDRPETACERLFCPQPDMADLLRRRGDRLRSLESRRPLQDFDLVGITLQHELTYTNVLHLLDLGGVPLLAAERGGGDPFIIGGGPCAMNPEPVAEFFDAFVIGEGEDAVQEIVDAYLAWHKTVGERESRTKQQRGEFLRELAAIEGVYVPALYREHREPDGRRWAGEPLGAGVRARITRRIVADLDAAPFPTRPIVPFAEIVHDRAMVEIMRGCGRGCRFCQAGVVYRPARTRSLETLKRQCDRIIASTGYEQIAPLALSCPDYPHISALLTHITTAYRDQHVSASLPSLRVDTFSVSLAEKLQRVRKSGLTLAPEAGSQRLRDVINKNVTDDDILAATRAAFEAGWHRLKLYFMIGLPTEADEDVAAIAEVASRVRDTGDEVLGKERRSRVAISVSVNAFIPKPHTPFQWAQQATAEEVEHKLAVLQRRLRDRRIKLSWSDPHSALLEGALSRGGRELGPVVRRAYDAGCTFDSWYDYFDYGKWQAAFAAEKRDLEAEARRRWDPRDPVPWGHIESGVEREFLLCEAQRATEALRTPDCFLEACNGCGMRKLVQCPGAGEPA